MNVKEAINERRAYRSLKKISVSKELLYDLFSCAELAPSCFNNQPWRYIAVFDPETLEKVFSSFSKGNEWAFESSLVIAVCSKKEDDCVIKNRQYFLFDTGISVGFLILRATELGLVAHPIAGFDEEKAKDILAIPNEFTLISFVIIGKRSEKLNPVLSPKQIEAENKRPERLALGTILHLNKYGQQIN